MLSLSLARRNASTLALVGAAACLDPAALRAALASAAGLVLEAASLVIGAAALAALATRLGLGGKGGRTLAAWLSGLTGCGCGLLPGALSLPAAGFAWYAFGPGVAAARFAAGCAAALLAHRLERRRSNALADDLPASPRHESAHDTAEPLEQLAAIVPFALAGALAVEAIRALPPAIVGSVIAGFAAGALAGALSPCPLGALAVAASLRPVAPWVAAGLLASAGLVPARVAGFPNLLVADARLGYGLLGFLGVWVAGLGGAGLVHPRLTIPVAVAAIAGFVAVVRRARVRASLLGPALVALALVLGSPLPRYALGESAGADAFAGEPVHFIGVVERHGDAALLVRFAITCCRADASPVALRLDRATELAAGSWAAVDGVFRTDAAGLVVHVVRLRPVAQPRDPFLYR